MRIAVALAVASSGCGVGKYLAKDPVIGPWARQSSYGSTPSGASYLGPPLSSLPPIPLMVWGAAYDLDFVLVDHHPAWDMHELARLETPTGPLWIAKDARAGTLDQIVTTSLPAPDALLPELPVERHASPIDVVDHSEGDRLDLTFHYVNPDGEPVDVAVEGKAPDKLARHRNGPTLGHSHNAVLVALDVAENRPLSKAEISIGGEDQKLRHLAGVVPFAFTLVQSQGGLAVGKWTVEATPAGPVTHHAMRSGGTIDAAWTVDDDGARVHARQVSDLRTIELVYRKVDGDGLELEQMAVYQYARSAAVTHLSLSPAMPDVRRKFSGTVESRYVLDVDGQEGQATGVIAARWDGETVIVDVRPEAPEWTLDRPLRSTLVLAADGTESVETVRIAPQ